jgi:hypothetical protein
VGRRDLDGRLAAPFRYHGSVAHLTRAALRGAIAATLVAAAIALGAALVRVSPWLLDPAVTFRVAAPFARSLSVVALEAALAIGWPLGWALATHGAVLRGEGRVLALLGERPARTVARLSPQAVALALLLGGLAWASARESTEPGRVVRELIADGKAACRAATSPRTYVVPFLGATWLCDPGAGTPSCERGVVPRLVGEGPGPLAALVFSAADARVSGDLSRIELDDARVAIAHPLASLHVDSLRVRGAPPWGHGGGVSPPTRAVALGLAVALSALAAVGIGLMRRNGRAPSRIDAFGTGAAGPITALGLLRLFERGSVPLSGDAACVLLVPVLAVGAVGLVAWTAARLPALWHAASS